MIEPWVYKFLALAAAAVLVCALYLFDPRARG